MGWLRYCSTNKFKYSTVWFSHLPRFKTNETDKLYEPVS